MLDQRSTGPGFAEAPADFRAAATQPLSSLPDPTFADGLGEAQEAWLVTGVVGAAIFILVFPQATLLAFVLVLTLAFVALVGLRALFMVLPAVSRRDLLLSPNLATAEDDWPVYSVLIPLHREADVVPILVDAIGQLDYPADRLDVKLILESDDRDTLAAVMATPLPAHFELVMVPDSQPKTKPKALNHALPRARGEFLVIFDAEDRPESDQLRKAAVALRACPREVACLQARLNYFNAGENWLTRMFAIEYAVWFEILLPGLGALRLPIPLGGTSIHFRTDVLRELRAWDPHNVTEDADLGLRLARHGYVCRMLDSTTFEEANCRLPNWIRQRSRWLKGYAQTWLAHMRSPRRLLDDLGLRGFLGVQVVLLGAVLGALAHPVLWAIHGTWLITGTGRFDPLFPQELALLNTGLLVLGSGIVVASGMMAVIHRGFGWLVAWCPLLVFYWPLASIAAWRGLVQLITAPSYWEKTRHGLTRSTGADRMRALARIRKGRQP